MRTARAAVAAAILLAVGACSDPPASPGHSAGSSPSFVEGSTMAALSDSGTVRIGVKTDIPGLGYRAPGSPSDAAPVGFDIEIAKIVAAGLRIPADKIQWVSLQTFDRVNALTEAKADLVIASFSMTPERASIIGQAGPYYVTGQQIMVRDDSDISGLDDMAGRTICSVAGSESDKPLVDKGAVTKAYTSYGACVDALLDGDLDAVSTDGALLAGFLEMHSDELSIVGAPFSPQRYGIGYRLGDNAMCRFLRAALLAAYDSGEWKKAFESTIGKSGIEAPVPPRPDDCPSD